MGNVFLIFAFLLNAGANILLKVGARDGVVFHGLSISQIAYHNWAVLLGVFMFALNAVCYFLALRTIPISTAYPIMVAMSFIIINAFAYQIFKENITVWQLAGYLLVVLGLYLVVHMAKN